MTANTIGISLIAHILLGAILGCAVQKPVVVPQVNSLVQEARDFVLAVSDKMPLWDADGVSRYERGEIAAVKADIAVAKQANSEVELLKAVSKLHEDWDKLVALDDLLRHVSLT